MNLYRLLDVPVVYRTARFVLAPSMDRIVTKTSCRTFAGLAERRELHSTSDADHLRGCGSSHEACRLDLCHAYTQRFPRMGEVTRPQ